MHEFAYLMENYVATVSRFKESVTKTFTETLPVAVTILFSILATAEQVKLPNNIKYVNTTEAFSYTEIGGMNCQTKNPSNYKDNSYIFVLGRGGTWYHDYTVSVLDLKIGKAQMLEYKDNQLCSGSDKPFFKIENGIPTVGVIGTSRRPVVMALNKLET